jgi:DNA-binding CsgD family transcriptional regulator
MLEDDYFNGTKLYHRELAKLMSPISKYLGIKQAMYTNIAKNGMCFTTCTNVEAIEDHLARRGYLHNTSHVHPDNMHNGFAFDNACPNETYKNLNLYTYITKFDWHNSFIYAEKTSDGGYFSTCFATDKENFAISNRVANETGIIKKLIRDLHKKMMLLFSKDMEKYKMDFSALSGEAFHTTKGRVYNEQTEIQKKNKIKLLQESGILSGLNDSDILAKVQLTAQELNCLRLYHDNHTIKQVARALNLASTTVTSYIENIKEKLDCNNKNDLFEKVEILESLGHIYL